MGATIRGSGTLIEYVIGLLADFIKEVRQSLIKTFYSQDVDNSFLANALRFFYIPEIVVRHICFVVHSFIVFISAVTIIVFVYLCIDRICDGIFTGTKYW